MAAVIARPDGSLQVERLLEIRKVVHSKLSSSLN